MSSKVGAAASPEVASGPRLDFAHIPVIPSPVQRKATVSSPGDLHEREADEIAERVVRAIDASPAAAPAGSAGASIRRKCDCEEEERQQIQTKAESRASTGAAPTAGLGTAPACGVGHSGEAPPSVMERLRELRGSPLPAATRMSMGQAFGSDFWRVRVHTGSDAAHLAHALHARAFTWGNDIVFGAGEFQPSSTDGQKLLAHELAHTLQQRGIRRQIQRWSYGSVPVPNWLAAFNIRPAPATDRPRVQAAMDLIQEVVSDRTHHQGCHDQFANSCPGGNVSTLPTLVQNMVMWKITDRDALARGDVNGSNMAYTDLGIDASARDFAGTILHEMGHNCGVPGTSTHWVADRTALYCLGGETSNTFGFSSGPVFGGDPAMLLSYRRLLTSLAHGNLRLSTGVDLNVVGLASLPTKAAEFGSAGLQLNSRIGGWGAEGWGGLRFLMGTGPSLGRFRIDPASPAGPGGASPPTVLSAGWMVTVGLGAQFYIPTGSAGRVVPMSLDASYRLIVPLNKEAQMLHGLMFGASFSF